MAFNVKLTTAGLAVFADAVANSTPVTLFEIGIGDGNGSAITPTGGETALYNELDRHPILESSIDPDHPNWIVVDVLVPAESGGYTIREIGLYDDADTLLAIASYPEQYKPTLAEGFGEDLRIKFIMEVTNASEVTIIDGGTVEYATITRLYQAMTQVVNWYTLNW